MLSTMMRQRTFQAADIEKIFGLKRTTLRQWIDLEFVEPSVEKAAGSGKPNLFSMGDLYRIGMIRFMTQMGFNRGLAASLLRSYDLQKMREDGAKLWKLNIVRAIVDGEPSANSTFIFGDEVSFSLPHVDAVDSILLINFAKIADQIDSKIK